MGLGLVVLGIYIFKNIWVFGYPFFPVQMFDFGVSWSPNAEILKQSSEVAILKTYDLKFTISEIQQFTTWDYIYHWFTLHSYKKYIHIAFVLLMVIYTIFTFQKKQKTLYLLWISILLKTIFVLYFSAQFRFFIDVFFVAFVVVFGLKVKEKISLLSFSLGAVLVLFLMSFPKILQSQVRTFKLGHYMQGFTVTQLYRPAVFELNSYQTFKIGNLDFNVPNYDLSFDTPQPSLSPYSVKKYYEAGIFPQKISENIQDGFVWKKLSPEEKEELKKIDVLTLENEKINKMYKELSETKLSIEQMSVLELQKNISEKTNELATVNQSISEKTNFLNEVLTRINNLLSHERNLQSQLTVLESDIAMEEFGLYKPRYDFASSLEYKDKLNVIREMQKAMIKSKSAVNYFENWTVDGSKAKGKKMTNDNIKMILRSFNNECEAAINKVKFSNIQSIEKRIQTSFNQHNKLNETNKVSLTQRFLDLKFQAHVPMISAFQSTFHCHHTRHQTACSQFQFHSNA